MQLPVDVKALVDEATNIEEARTTPLSVSVYLDDKAPADLVAHVRNRFASLLPTVRMSISYLSNSPVLNPTDDMAVLVAGPSDGIGAFAAKVRAVGVPVMVATTMPSTVERKAAEEGNAIPAGDIVSPLGETGASDISNLASKAAADASATISGVARSISGGTQLGNLVSSAADVVTDYFSSLIHPKEKTRVYVDVAAGTFVSEEPYKLDEQSAKAFDLRMGDWVMEACTEKRLAFSIAFPFMRRSLANDAVFATSLQNAAVGLVPFIPGADLPIMTLNQAKMVLEIAAAYGEAMGLDRAKEIIAVVGNAFFWRTVARELTEFVPVLGWLVRPAIGYTGTTAIGFAIIEYFEGGEDAAGVAAVATAAVEKGTQVVEKLQSNLANMQTADASQSSK